MSPLTRPVRRSHSARPPQAPARNRRPPDQQQPRVGLSGVPPPATSGPEPEGPPTRPQGVPGLPNSQARPAGGAHLPEAPSRTPGPLRSPHGGSHRSSVSRNAQASQPVRWRQRLWAGCRGEREALWD